MLARDIAVGAIAGLTAVVLTTVGQAVVKKLRGKDDVEIEIHETDTVVEEE